MPRGFSGEAMTDYVYTRRSRADLLQVQVQVCHTEIRPGEFHEGWRIIYLPGILTMDNVRGLEELVAMIRKDVRLRIKDDRINAKVLKKMLK